MRPAAEPHEQELGTPPAEHPLGPAPSRWPILMALAVSVAVGGLMISPLISAGVALVVLTVAIAWGVEGGHE